MANLDYAGGGDWAGNPWTPELPDDSQLLCYLFCAFLEVPGWVFAVDGTATAVGGGGGSLLSSSGGASGGGGRGGGGGGGGGGSGGGAGGSGSGSGGCGGALYFAQPPPTHVQR